MVEESILHQIENTIYSNSSGDRINVPRIITDYGTTCQQHNSILMEFIDGTEIKQSGWVIDEEFTGCMSYEMENTIYQLAAIAGIGHFDINDGNILVDKKGKFGQLILV